MNRFLPIAILLLAAALVIYSVVQSPTPDTVTVAATNTPRTGGTLALDPSAKETGKQDLTTDSEPGDAAENVAPTEDETRPATDIYKTADEAFEAVKKGALSFDDIILEQFTLVGDDCSWCGQFYTEVRDILANPATTNEQKSYYAELLAVSGRADNLKSLIDGAKSAQGEGKDLYLEAIQLANGKQDVLKLLSSELDTVGTNTELRDSLVAAVTNNGSADAAKILYEASVKAGDPDGWYSQGTGLGEFVPDPQDPDTMSYLRSMSEKRDQYSKNAMRALLNSGLPGLRMVTEMLANSNNPDFDQEVIKDLKDHVPYDEEIEKYNNEQMVNSSNPNIKFFGGEIKNDFNQTLSDSNSEGDAAAAQ